MAAKRRNNEAIMFYTTPRVRAAVDRLVRSKQKEWPERRATIAETLATIILDAERRLS